MTQPAKRGGARPGAGRKKLPETKVNLTVSLTPATKKRITDTAKAEGVSASELVGRWGDALEP